MDIGFLLLVSLVLAVMLLAALASIRRLWHGR